MITSSCCIIMRRIIISSMMVLMYVNVSHDHAVRVERRRKEEEEQETTTTSVLGIGCWMVAARIAIAIAIARRPSKTTSSRCRLLTAYYDQLTLCWCWWRITRIGGAGSSWCWWVRVIMIIMQIVKVEKHHPHILVLAFTFLQLLSQDFCSGIVLWQQGVVLWEGESCCGMLLALTCRHHGV